MGRTRALLAVFGALTALAVVVLLLFPGDTARLFAWTIEPPASAAFLGAGYASGFVLVVLSARAWHWVGTRTPLLTILLFTLLTLIATLLHLERFHLAGNPPLAQFAAWFWLAVYVVVPPATVLLVRSQDRTAPPAPDPRPLARPLRLALLVEGVVMLVVGAVLFVAPAAGAVLWPWPLSPLSGRAVAAWLIAFGAAALKVVHEDDAGRLRVPGIAYAVFGALTAAVLLVAPGPVRWDSAAAWAYLVVAVAVAVTGVVAARATPHPAGAGPAGPPVDSGGSAAGHAGEGE